MVPHPGDEVLSLLLGQGALIVPEQLAGVAEDQQLHSVPPAAAGSAGPGLLLRATFPLGFGAASARAVHDSVAGVQAGAVVRRADVPDGSAWPRPSVTSAASRPQPRHRRHSGQQNGRSATSGERRPHFRQATAADSPPPGAVGAARKYSCLQPVASGGAATAGAFVLAGRARFLVSASSGGYPQPWRKSGNGSHGAAPGPGGRGAEGGRALRVGPHAGWPGAVASGGPQFRGAGGPGRPCGRAVQTAPGQGAGGGGAAAAAGDAQHLCVCWFPDALAAPACGLRAWATALALHGARAQGAG